MSSNVYSKEQAIVVILKKVADHEEATLLVEKIKETFLVPNGLFGYKISMFDEKVSGLHLIVEINESVPFMKIIETVGKCKISRVRSIAEFIPECAAFIAMKRKERAEQAIAQATEPAVVEEKEKEPEVPAKKVRKGAPKVK